MEDLVAVEVTTTEDQRCWFVTWGRVQHRVDPTPLERLILAVAHHFALPGTPASARVCDSLREAAGAPLFYEALFTFAQTPIRFGSEHAKWRKRMAKRMKDGREIYFAGPWREDDHA